MKIIQMELDWIEKQSGFSLENVSYLMDTLLVLVNQYAGQFFRDQISLLFTETDTGHSTMREFAVVLINSLEKMFFLTPNEILKNDTRIKNIQ